MLVYDLDKQGVARVPLWIQRRGTKILRRFQFIVDTGATLSVMPLDTVIVELGYSLEWIKKNA